MVYFLWCRILEGAGRQREAANCLFYCGCYHIKLAGRARDAEALSLAFGLARSDVGAALQTYAECSQDLDMAAKAHLRLAQLHAVTLFTLARMNNPLALSQGTAEQGELVEGCGTEAARERSPCTANGGGIVPPPAELCTVAWDHLIAAEAVFDHMREQARAGLHARDPGDSRVPGETRERWAWGSQQVYENALLLLTQQNAWESAWVWLQHAKARALCDSLGMGFLVPPRVDRSLREHPSAHNLVQEEAALLRELGAGGAEGSLRQIRQRLWEVRQQQCQLAAACPALHAYLDFCSGDWLLLLTGLVRDTSPFSAGVDRNDDTSFCLGGHNLGMLCVLRSWSSTTRSQTLCHSKAIQAMHYVQGRRCTVSLQ